MTADDIAELERLLAEYRAMWSGAFDLNPGGKGKARKLLETALVRHADDLIFAAKLVKDVTDRQIDEAMRQVPVSGHG